MTVPSPPTGPRRLFDALLFAVFLGVLSAPLAAMVLRRAPSGAGPGAENRALPPRPHLAWQWDALRSFPDRCEAYLESTFGLRDLLIRAYSRYSVGVLKASPSPKVVLGREDWLYFNGDPAAEDPSPIEDYTGLHPLPPAQLEALRYLYQDQADYLRGLGIRYLLVLLPTKPFVYPEYLPRQVVRARDTSWREQLTAYLRAHTDVDVLDLGPPIQDLARTEQAFFRTDSHWTPLGGFHGAGAIVRALQPWFPQLEPVPESRYRRKPGEVKHGDLGRLINLQDRYGEVYVALEPGPGLTATNQALSAAAYAPIVGGTGDAGAPTAMVYRDSYAEYLYPFLSEHFRWVRYEWAQTGTRMDGIEAARPDVVLQVTCDRVLARPLLIAPRIREAASRARFDRARPVARYSAADGFAGVTVRGDARGGETADGLAVSADGDGEGARVVLPLPVDAATRLPVLRLEIRPGRAGVLTVTAPTRAPRRGKPAPEIGLGRVRLERGRNVLHLTLTDPGIRDHLTLALEPGTGGCLLYHAELRTLPRHGTPPAPGG